MATLNNEFGYKKINKFIPPDNFTFWRSEFLAFRPPPKMTVSEWSDERRVLQPGTSRQPGPWSTEITPYLKDVMDTYNDPDIRHIVLCFCTQVGKTESLYNILGFIIDMESYSTLLVYPRDTDAKQVSRTRVKPMIEACPTLKDKIPSARDLYQIMEMHFPGMALYLAGANSAAALSQKPCRNVLRDEIDKYPLKLGDHAGPLELSEERTKGFYDIRKIIDVSSPTLENVGIWKQLKDCDEIREFYVPCPHCGTYQVLEFNEERVKFDLEGEGRRRLAHAKETARYICAECQGEIRDKDKIIMISEGKWRSKDPHPYKIEKIGFHLNSLYSSFLTFADVVEKFLTSKDDKKKLKTFHNDWLALPFKDIQVERKEDDILNLRDERPAGIIPEDTIAITAGVDVQDYGFWYVVRAWKYGTLEESHLIRYGYVDTWEAIDMVLFGSEYKDADDKDYFINVVFIDAMGHRTRQVYDYCRPRNRTRATKGEERMVTPTKVSRLDHYPDGKKMPGGLSLIRISTQYFKDEIHNKLTISPGDPGAYYIHKDTDTVYATHMTTEYRNDLGEWIQPEGKPNHLWDCEVLAYAAYNFIGAKYWKRPGDKVVETERPGQKKGSGFLPKRKNFLGRR